jgi:hypothetical protein
VANADGEPVNDDTFLEGDTGGMSTWADLKEQARTLLGIDLSDSDVFNVPMLATEQYGRFLRGPAGYPPAGERARCRHDPQHGR